MDFRTPLPNSAALSPHPELSGRAIDWRLVLLLACVGAVNYCDRTAISAVLPLIRTDLGASDVGLAAIGSVFLWTYAVGSLFAGWLSDRVPRTAVVIASLAAWSAVTIWTGFARSLTELLATRFVLGLAESAYLPAAVALLADYHGPARRGTAIGIHTAGLSFGTIAGATLAGYLGERYGWRSTFLLLGVAGLALAAFSFIALRNRNVPVEGTRKLSPFSTLPRVPSYWILLAQSMAAAVGVWVFMNWLPLYFQETYGMSLAFAGFSGTVLLQLPSVAGIVGGGVLSDRIASRNRAARMLLQSACYLAATPVVLMFTMGAAFGFAAAAVVGFALLRAVAMSNENPLLCDLIPAAGRSSAIGLMNAAQCFTGGLGVLLAGYLKKDYGLSGAFAAVSVLTLLCSCITAFGYFTVLRRDLPQGKASV